MPTIGQLHMITRLSAALINVVEEKYQLDLGREIREKALLAFRGEEVVPVGARVVAISPNGRKWDIQVIPNQEAEITEDEETVFLHGELIKARVGEPPIWRIAIFEL